MIVKCPTCQKPVTWDQSFPFKPFCQERCRLIDLGAWANGSYQIPVAGDIEESLDDENA